MNDNSEAGSSFAYYNTVKVKPWKGLREGM